MMCRARMRRCRTEKLQEQMTLLLDWEEVHHGTKGLERGSCSAEELGLTRDQGKIGDGFGEPGPGEHTKAWPVQGHAHFILPQQAGKVSAALMANLLSYGMSSLSPGAMGLA